MVLGASLLCSIIFVGLALFVVNAGNIGWEALSETWHFIFIAEGAILIIQLLLIMLFSLINRPAMDKLFAFTELLLSYKVAVVPFIPILMFAKDHGVYDIYLSVAQDILLIGFVMHIILLCILVYFTLKDTENMSIARICLIWSTPVILAVLFIIRIIAVSDILYIGELGGLLISFTIVFVAVLIGNLPYAIEPVYIISESSLFNPPSPQKIYNKRLKKKKRKKRKS